MALLEALATVLVYLGLWTLCYGIGSRLLSRRRTPRELRGDWWVAFEREFHAYASSPQSPNDSARSDDSTGGRMGPSQDQAPL